MIGSYYNLLTKFYDLEHSDCSSNPYYSSLIFKIQKLLMLLALSSVVKKSQHYSMIRNFSGRVVKGRQN